MKKIKEHLKRNFAIYAVLLTCIVVVCMALFLTREEKKETVDTSMFQVLTLKETLKLFETDEPKLLVISVSECTATIGYVPYLQIAQAKYGYTTYYLELDDLDYYSKDFQTLLSKLDMEYRFQNKVDKFSAFIGSTPMTVIIKNKKMVHGYIGSMDTDTLYTITKLYGVTNEKKN